MTSTTPPDIAKRVEAYIPRFQLTKLLNQDQAGRRISLLGTIDSQPALLIAERAAFATDTPHLASFPTSLSNIKNLGANDIYAWFLANSNASSSSSGDVDIPPDFKLNLIYPCTEKHVKKYSSQALRVVNETPEIYAKYVRPWIQRQREKGTLNWVFNIIEGRTEQDDVMYRETDPKDGFLLLPDLNWDRKTMTSLHLLGLVERRDIWSVRDLKKGDVRWLEHVVGKLVDATTGLYPGVGRDELKLYVHCKFARLRYFSAFFRFADFLSFFLFLWNLNASNELQTNQRITTFTSTSCTSCSKLAPRNPLGKLWVSRTSFPRWRTWRVTIRPECKM